MGLSQTLESPVDEKVPQEDALECYGKRVLS